MKSLVRDPLAAIPPSRHPFQIFALLAGLIGGVGNLFFEPETLFSETVLEPYSVDVMWSLLLIVSASVAVAGAWWKDEITGLMMERLALRFFGYGAFLYAGVTMGVAQIFGQTLIFTFGIGIAALWRTRHVRKEIELHVARRQMLGHAEREERGQNGGPE